MRRDIYEVYGDFLSGEKLDVAKRFRDLSMPQVVERTEYLRRRCIGRKVLHIGCLDHPEVILEKVTNGTWLHTIISSASELCLGIDVNFAGYELIRKELGIENILLLDLSNLLENKDLDKLRQVSWDLILCPEILEHITNHKQFLQNLRSLSDEETTLVVTGPNAFSLDNFIHTLRGFESINSDHKYWFTFYTLSNILSANGWQARRVVYYEYTRDRLWQYIIQRMATKISRAFSDGLIIEATSSAHSAS